MIGWFGSDIYDGAKKLVSDAADAVGGALTSVPGVKELAGAAGDFAKTGVGEVTLRALSSALYGTVAWPLGPQLASVSWAIPGLMRGEPIEKAWFDELKFRTEKAAEILGPGIVAEFGDQLQKALRQLDQELGVGNLVEEGTKELAARLGIREDAAAYAKAMWNHVELPPFAQFDPATGRENPTVALGRRRTVAPAPKVSLVETARVGFTFKSLGLVPEKAAAAAPAPVRVSRSPESEQRKLYGDVALGAVVVAAGGMLYWWYKG